MTANLAAVRPLICSALRPWMQYAQSDDERADLVQTAVTAVIAYVRDGKMPSEGTARQVRAIAMRAIIAERKYLSNRKADRVKAGLPDASAVRLMRPDLHAKRPELSDAIIEAHREASASEPEEPTEAERLARAE